MEENNGKVPSAMQAKTNNATEADYDRYLQNRK